MKNDLTKKAQYEQTEPTYSKPFLHKFFMAMDWKWIGITYIATTLFFGIVAIIEKNWLALIGGFFTITFLIICACVRIAWPVFKNGR
jgi:hypothetical protein